MRLSKLIAASAFMASVTLLMAVPSGAQPGTQPTNRLQNDQLSKRPLKAQVNPNTPQPTRVVRDHRTGAANSSPSGGVRVTSSGKPRKPSTEKCIKSVLGGPCVGVSDVKKAYAGAKGKVQSTLGLKPDNPRDHRKK